MKKTVVLFLLSLALMGPSAARFSAKEKFRPRPAGPALDCKLAASAIEKTICSDAALSAQDMALSETYNSIRWGNGTTVARDKLRTLQRDWLTTRDRVCADARNVTACLNDQYAAQYDRLSHWLSTIPHRP